MEIKLYNKKTLILWILIFVLIVVVSVVIFDEEEICLKRIAEENCENLGLGEGKIYENTKFTKTYICSDKPIYKATSKIYYFKLTEEQSCKNGN